MEHLGVVYIKIVPPPSGGYAGSYTNGVTSYTNTSGENGYIFVKADGTEYNGIKATTLSGNTVTDNGRYYFINEGASIVPTNTILPSTVASSYIEIDLTGEEYTAEDLVQLKLNAEISSAIGDIGYAVITNSKETPTNTEIQKGLVYITGTVANRDYTQILKGKKRYYLHLGYIKDAVTDGGSDRIVFNSLQTSKIESLDATITTIEPTITLEKEWYPYGTQITLSYPSATTGYYKYIYSDNSESEAFVVREPTKQVALEEDCTICVGYTEDCNEASKQFIVMANPSGLTMSEYYNNIGAIYPVMVKNQITGTVYGSDYYSCNSNINVAATQMGLTGAEEKLLYIQIIERPQEGYIGATKNGITSTTSSTVNNGYVFVTEEGDKIISPKITNLTIEPIENTIKATVEVSENITSYYYRIDKGSIQEETTNTYTFENVDMSTPHIVSVYVRNELGAVSEISYEYYSVLPTITVEGTPEIIEGTEWYPYGTNVTIKYGNDMSVITGVYSYIDERTNELSEESKTNATYTTPLYHSVTYIAKTENIIGRETEEVRKTINIMPDAGEVGATYYKDCVGKIYPVKITNDTSKVAYGTDTYKFDSSISTAASHIGLTEEIVYIKIVEGQDGGYVGSTRNGVTTSSNENTTNGYVFVNSETKQEIMK